MMREHFRLYSQKLRKVKVLVELNLARVSRIKAEVGLASSCPSSPLRQAIDPLSSSEPIQYWILIHPKVTRQLDSDA